MSITINTEPLPYSSQAIFDASTNITEDSSHVNVRVEAQIWDMNATDPVICKKTLAKGLSIFDFTSVLSDYIKFSNPSPFVDPETEDPYTVEIISPSKTGDNLITSWANKSGHEYDYLAATGSEITSCSGNAIGVSMIAESNDIAFEVGKIYVLLWRSATQTGEKPSIYIDSNSASRLVANSNYISEEIPDNGGGRYYFICKGTGTKKMAITLPAGVGYGSFSGDFALYEFSAHDWFKQYFIFFFEKYEDSDGVTQTYPASYTNNKLYTLFKSSIPEATFNNEYIMNGLAKKFLSPDGYFGGWQRSQEIMVNPATGNKSTILLTAIVDPSMVDYSVGFSNVYDSRVQGISCLDTKYSPIAVFPYRYYNAFDSLTGETIIRSNAILALGASRVSEYFRIIPDFKKYPYHIELSWLNELGGFSTLFFGNDFHKSKKAQKNTYKTGKYIPKLFNSTPISEVIAETRFLSNEEAEFLSDIITSPLVMEHSDSYQEVIVQNDSLPTRSKNDLFTCEITYMY